ncbi:MAG TPA: prolyl oligopeptidase family serine peptidase, partial [Lysobacter sp.]|nr:prolyl oligopeptidase family serine peptidase [Lysobacter sp.]
HQRGVWRRTTLAEFRKDQPQWETVIDLDAVNQAEGAAWVWKRAECLAPEYRRCLIALSPGGSDADVTREFDLVTKQFVQDGFFRPQAKGRLSWIDQDTVYAITDFGPDSSNKAGYSRFVREWKRDTPMASATTVFEGPADNVGYGLVATRDQTPGFVRDFILHYLDSRDTALYLRDDAGKLHKIDAPDTANKGVHREWLTIELREPWQVGGKTYTAGSLLAAKFDDYMAGKRVFDVLFEPTDRASLSTYTWTRSHLVLNVLEDVKNRLSVLTPGAGGWIRSAFAGAPAMGNVAVRAVDDIDSDAVWMTSTDFLTPTTLSLAEIGRAPEVLKTMPAFFDASKGVVEQHFAASKDGTRIPYFVVRPREMPQDGSTPTLMTGYGGFEISRLPNYSGAVGKGWLEKGGAYVVANIRGGGEYGPRWHQAALKSKRHKAYEDFAAVAEDLVARKITSARHLGIQGGSNGGLLMGNMLTQYPELFGAIVVQVPLLDMQRYHKLLAGASWMAEYGDPDKADEWAFIQTFSPYHLFDPNKSYPPTLFTTSTRDDRVHPGHARKMMAKMLEAGKDVRYYENIEGG